MQINSVVIVGATTHGCAIAALAARASYRTILEDNSAFALERGIAGIAGALDREVFAGAISCDSREGALARIVTAASLQDACREADLIIEAAADEEEMKIELFTIFDKFAKPGAIFASTSASVPIDDLAAITVFPERSIGMRFLPDARRTVALELVRGRKTSEETMAACREFGGRLGLEVHAMDEGTKIAAQGSCMWQA